MSLRCRALCARRDERGAVAVIAAGMVVVLVAVAALTVDIGMQRVARTDMQSLADIVALDLALELGTRTVDEFENNEPTIDDLAEDSKLRNTGTLGESPTLDPTLGTLDADGEFLELSGAELPTAVRVSARTSVDFAFGFASGGSAERAAVSQQTEDTACFEMGSFAAALDLGQSIVGPFADALGLATDLSLASYQALAGVNVSLLDIAADPSIGSPTALLDPTGITVGALLNATVYALKHDEKNGDTETALALAALNNLLAASSGLALDNTVVVPGVVGVDLGDTASLAADLNVLELIGTSLSLANGENFLASSVPVNIPGLGPGGVTVSAIQGLRRACGRPHTERATARQSQVSVGLSLGPSTLPVIPTSFAGITSGSISATLGALTLSGGVGNAQGVLASVDHCGDGTDGDPDIYTVDVTSGLVGIKLALPVTINGSVVIGGTTTNGVLDLVDGILNIGLLDSLLGSLLYPRYRNVKLSVSVENLGVNLSASSSGMTGAGSPQLRVPDNVRSGDDPVSVPDPVQPLALGTVSLPSDSLTTGTIKLQVTYEKKASVLSNWVPVTTPLGEFDVSNLATIPVVGPTIKAVLNGVVSGVNSGLVGPLNSTLATLLPLLGLSGAGADLYSVARPLCGGPPQLVG